MSMEILDRKHQDRSRKKLPRLGFVFSDDAYEAHVVWIYGKVRSGRLNVGDDMRRTTATTCDQPRLDDACGRRPRGEDEMRCGAVRHGAGGSAVID